MIANYHTHSPRCRHAQGTEEEYVQAALKSGLKILGFSDHTPYWFRDGYYSHMRMFPEQLEEYCASVLRMRQHYGNRLQIHLGMEVEFYPDFFDELLHRLRDQGIEYFLLGQHWVGNEMGEPYCGRATGDETLLERYCCQVMHAMNTGVFTYLAHPDLIHYVGEEAVYKRHIRQLCREANSCGIPLEINLLGLGEGRHYPHPWFWQVAAEENCKCVIGCDAHTPEAIAQMTALNRAMDMVSDYGLTLLETVDLRSIG